MKKILVIAFSDINHDARVARQVNFLSGQYEVNLVCFDSPKTLNIEAFHVKRIKPNFFQKGLGSVLLLTGLFKYAYKVIYDFPDLRKQLEIKNYNLIIANDIESLPLAFTIKKKAKILFDAHEYAPRHFEDKLLWRIFFQRFNKYLCKTYLPKVDLMITVGEGLAKEYAANYPVKPIVITNANWYKTLTPAKVDCNHIRLIHHGAANPSRQLEIMIEMMNHLDQRFTLDLMLITPSIANKKTRKYLQSLKNLINNNPRIKILQPVKSDKVVEAIHQYDIGIFLLPPVNFNYANTLPNKLFDFIQARLAIAIGPTPEMETLVKKYNLGVVSDNFTPLSLATKINQLTIDQIAQYKNNSNLAAVELCAEKNKELLNGLIKNLLKE